MVNVPSPVSSPYPPTTGLPATGGGLLSYLPVGFFGSVMGLTGLSLAWRLAHSLYPLAAPSWIADLIAWVALVSFVALTLGYAIKAITAPASVVAEFHHPTAGNLFGTFLISLLLLPMVLAPVYAPVARTIWVVGAVGMLVFAWLIVSRWMGERQIATDATPAWIVPVVGALDIPLALPSLGWSHQGLMLVGLAIGLFFAVPIFTMIFSRLVFEPPLPPAMQPALLIMVAPFSVGFSAYVTTTGHADLFAKALYVLMLFMLAVLAGRLRHLLACCPFRVSWWAVSFPLAACAIAALRFAAVSRDPFKDEVAVALLLGATVVIVALLVRTVIGIVRGELKALSA